MSTHSMNSPVFREVQLMRQWWVWGILLLVAGFQWYIFIAQIILGMPVGNNPAPDWVTWLTWSIFGVGFPLLLWSFHLTTEVGQDYLLVRWFPFYRRLLVYSDIASCEAVTYHPLLQFGGWGIRWSRRHGWAYSMSGNQGVQLVLGNGSRVLLGSHQAAGLAAAITSRRQEKLR